MNSKKSIINSMSLSRRRFIQTTSVATLGGLAAPSILSGKAWAQGLKGTVTLATWPNYHNMENIAKFEELTGVTVNVVAFGSNEEMMAKMQAGDAGFDVVCPSNYAVAPYADLELIRPLDLDRINNYAPAEQDSRFVDVGTVAGEVYAIHKNWGTTGYAYNSELVSERPTTQREFFDLTNSKYSGFSTVLDHQLSTLGSSLVSLGFSLNSLEPEEIAAGEKQLIESKPSLFAITSSPQPGLRSNDALLGMCWNFDAVQMRRDNPAIEYVVATDGGEVWSDFWVIAQDAPNPDAAHALINFMLDPEINFAEFAGHGSAIADNRVTAMMDASVKEDPVLYPSQELLENLEFASSEALVDENRNEAFARFKAA